ncbi:hypothetical protein [Sphingomonas carotinifaciens]|uniref:hypothetical protein n=1 Tax=Sphingomonas carotinifaciens TaxID=1166323 RepID=UPI000DD8841E|nr:hypothetical protein [Sphingomonas carotinifaciens]
MIWKMGATMGALLPLAAAAVASDKGATTATSVPVIWHFAGYPFEAGSMIAALCACIAVRFYVAQTDRQQHRWTVDAPVTVLAVLFTAGAVIRLRPDPALALVYGTGLGALGVGIITIALNFVRAKFPGGNDQPGA